MGRRLRRYKEEAKGDTYGAYLWEARSLCFPFVCFQGPVSVSVWGVCFGTCVFPTYVFRVFVCLTCFRVMFFLCVFSCLTPPLKVYVFSVFSVFG